MFSKEDFGEIKTFNLQALPTIPIKLQDYINSLKSTTNLNDLYNLLKERSFHAVKEPELEWINSALSEDVKLFMFNYFSLSDNSETDLLRRLWFFIDTLYDSSRINCRR